MSRLVELQKTLYTSRNPTRRWLHTSRRDLVREAIRTAPVDREMYALEVGPGSGVYLPDLCRRFGLVTALDVEPQHIAFLDGMAADLPNLELKIGDLCEIKWPNLFDLALCSEVIEHVSDPQAFVTGLSAAVRPRGIVILSTPQPFSLMEITSSIGLSRPLIGLVRLIYREPVLPTGHISVMPRHKVVQLLEGAGLQILSARYFGAYVPVLAEFGGKAAVSLLRRAEALVQGTPMQSLLWTQMYIARKRD
jgi:2-polyprenyl-3-methyl-5-hydroxy-6-metoxy-1,4-benzoquinol methylase